MYSKEERNCLAKWGRILGLLGLIFGSSFLGSCAAIPITGLDIQPMHLDMTASDAGWDIQPKEGYEDGPLWLNKAMARITGPPTTVAWLTLRYRSKYGTWPETLAQLEPDRSSLRAMLERVKEASFTPLSPSKVQLTMIYDKGIPADITLAVDAPAAE